MIFRMINGQVVPMPNLHDKDKSKKSYGVMSPLSLEHLSSIREHAYRPNFTCQQCGTRVWRCESVHKEELILEEFGPPWATHICSKNDLLDYEKQKETQISTKLLQDKNNLAWWRDGWRQITDTRLEPSGLSDYMELIFHIRKCKRSVLLRTSCLKLNWIDLDTAKDRFRTVAAFIREHRPNTFDISLLDERLRKIRLQGERRPTTSL